MLHYPKESAAEAGQQVTAGQACAVVESVKAASDVYAPIDGEVIAANASLGDRPESINQDAYAAWLFRLRPRDAGATGRLIDADTYARDVAQPK